MGNESAKSQVPVLALVYHLLRPRRDGRTPQPVEIIGKLQHRVPRARIGQLSGHLPRLVSAVEPLQGFVQLWSSGPPMRSGIGQFSAALCGRELRVAYPGHPGVTDETAFQIVVQSPSDISTAKRRPAPGLSFVTVSVVAGFDRRRPARHFSASTTYGDLTPG